MFHTERLNGVQIQTDEYLLVSYEDWSKVKSPARAKRRLKRGFPQRIERKWKPDTNVYTIGGWCVMHPVTFESLKAHVDTTSGWAGN